MKLSFAALVAVFTIGCVIETPKQRFPPLPQGVQTEPDYFEAKHLQYEKDRIARKKAEDEYVAFSNLVPRTPCLQCDAKRAELANVRLELAAAARVREDYARDHCTLTKRSRTRVYAWGERSVVGPETAYICDGRLVDNLESVREQNLSIRQGNLLSWIRRECDVAGKYRVIGEHYCVE